MGVKILTPINGGAFCFEKVSKSEAFLRHVCVDHYILLF